MSKIKVKFDDLEEFANQIGRVERECDEALEVLNWHFTSLLANFPGVLPDSIHALEYELRYSINEYKNKIDEAQRLIRLTAAEMEKDEQKMGNKVGEFFLELVGWNDAQRKSVNMIRLPVRNSLLATVYLRDVFWRFRYFPR